MKQGRRLNKKSVRFRKKLLMENTSVYIVRKENTNRKKHERIP